MTGNTPWKRPPPHALTAPHRTLLAVTCIHTFRSGSSTWLAERPNGVRENHDQWRCFARRVLVFSAAIVRGVFLWMDPSCWKQKVTPISAQAGSRHCARSATSAARLPRTTLIPSPCRAMLKRSPRLHRSQMLSGSRIAASPHSVHLATSCRLPLNPAVPHRYNSLSTWAFRTSCRTKRSTRAADRADSENNGFWPPPGYRSR